MRHRRRAAAGAAAADRLRGAVAVSGTTAATHSYWVFPVLVDRPADLMGELWAAGFDATPAMTSLAVVPVPDERREHDVPRARRLMKRVLFVPVYPAVSQRELVRLTDTLRRILANPARPPQRRLATASRLPT